MWRCRNCGATNQGGAYCTACGRPMETTFGAIGWKVQRLRFRRSGSDRWWVEGFKIGIAIGIVISMLFFGAVTILELYRSQNLTTAFGLLGSLLPLALVFSLLIALLFAAIFLFYGAVIKPICIALFCSVERFEQEYGPTET